jgi:hypothetical protein
MTISFLSLPGEVRNKIYVYLLVIDEPIEPHVHWYLELKHRIKILRTNKTIHRETSSLFYSQNHFDISQCSPVCIMQFLNSIGHTNASYIQDLRVYFPIIHEDKGNITIDRDFVAILEKLQGICTGVKILRTALDSSRYEYSQFEGSVILDKMLGLVTPRFRAMASLQQIVGTVFEEDPFIEDIMTGMEEHGWAHETQPRFPFEENWDYDYESDNEADYDSELDDGQYDMDENDGDASHTEEEFEESEE